MLTDRQTDRQTDTHTHRGRHTDTQTDTDTHTHTQFVGYLPGWRSCWLWRCPGTSIRQPFGALRFCTCAMRLFSLAFSGPPFQRRKRSRQSKPLCVCICICIRVCICICIRSLSLSLCVLSETLVCAIAQFKKLVWKQKHRLVRAGID